MSYQISFAGRDGMETTGQIFEMDGIIFLCVAGRSVKVPAKLYHESMRQWVEGRMTRPLVFVGDNGTRCTTNAPTGSGEVIVDLQ